MIRKNLKNDIRNSIQLPPDTRLEHYLYTTILHFVLIHLYRREKPQYTYWDIWIRALGNKMYLHKPKENPVP